jgi:hypothetical protein
MSWYPKFMADWKLFLLVVRVDKKCNIARPRKGAATFSIMTLSIMTFRITIKAWYSA